MEEIKLTQFSHGSGCGCKIAPKDLDEILKQVQPSLDTNLILGNETHDDAAVYDMKNGTALITTTDFFTPIVDDPIQFGRIAATNALSDIYAMGGKPIMAVAILGWPIGKLPTSMAGDVVEGGRLVCQEAGIPLAGGHSIDAPEPFFGLAVNGIVDIEHIKYNNKAQKGDLLFLTKPIGTGIVSTALKRKQHIPEHVDLIIEHMTTPNTIGGLFGQLDYVHAMTDVTGFGILGHLIEVCEGSGLSAKINFEQLPTLDDDVIGDYLKKFIFPDNTFRNFKAYSEKVSTLSGFQLQILCDPQTSGGLLVTVDPDFEQAFVDFCKNQGLNIESFGVMVEQTEPIVLVE